MVDSTKKSGKNILDAYVRQLQNRTVQKSIEIYEASEVEAQANRVTLSTTTCCVQR